MGKNQIIMVKQHAGRTADSYMTRLVSEGFRVDKLQFYSIHAPTEKKMPFPELNFNGILDMIKNFSKLWHNVTYLNDGNTMIVPLVTTIDPNPD